MRNRLPPLDAGESAENAYLAKFLGPDGRPRPVTKIVFELAGLEWHWTAWSHDRRLVTIPAEDLPKLLEATHLFIDPSRIMDPRHDGA